MLKVNNKPKPKVIRVPQKYAGEYIARRSWNDKRIVAHSSDIAEAYKEALKCGAKEPVLMFVREPNKVCIY